MTLSTADVASLLLALALLLVAAHAFGYLFVRLRQPRVIGELAGGLLLGPTVLGALAPDLQRQLFPAEGATAGVLGAVYQLGLLLLMFCSGAEMRSVFRRGEERTVSLVTLTGVALPFAAGLLVFQVFDGASLMGTAGNRTALVIVFALAVAVTSIPVISRIMFDLGVIDTPFARIVLGVAVLEDTLIYVVLTVTLGLVAAQHGDEFGLPAMLGLDAGAAPYVALHVVATLALFAVMVLFGSRAFDWTLRVRVNLLRRSPIAYQLIFLFVTTLVCVVLGITPLFGALLAGLASSSTTDCGAVQARKSIRDFSFAFFIPVYFAVIGLQLDLLRHFDLGFFLWFLVFACVAKSLSVYVGARVAGEHRDSAVNLAVAMNARGGPGIVLASVTFAAGIINAEFYAALILLSIVTSLLAGSWLGRLVRGGRPLRPTSQPRVAAAPALARTPEPVTVPAQIAR
jgi:Kef-type K+ transport system membrane component KefB